MEKFTANNMVRVGNFLKSLGFGDTPLEGEVSLEIDDYLSLQQRLVELDMRKPNDPFETLDNIPITYIFNEEDVIDERSKN